MNLGLACFLPCKPARGDQRIKGDTIGRSRQRSGARLDSMGLRTTVCVGISRLLNLRPRAQNKFFSHMHNLAFQHDVMSPELAWFSFTVTFKWVSGVISKYYFP